MPKNLRVQQSKFGSIAAELAKKGVGDVAWNADAMTAALKLLKIRTKDRGVNPFSVNKAQRDAIDKIMALPRNRQRRIIVLKARQLGFSTMIQGMGYALIRRQENTRVVTISHETGATERLHSMSAFFLDHDITQPEMKHNRTGAMEFADTQSSHYIGTAGSRAFGRGETLHYIHASEVAFWPDAESTMTGLLEALTKEGLVFAESTPNGIGGYFYDVWQNASDAGWLPLFYPWWWGEDYKLEIIDPDELLPLHDDEKELMEREGLTLEQIAWRRDKIKTLRDKFFQEYPEDPESCFLSSGMPYFDLVVLRRLEKDTVRDPLSEDRGLKVWEEPRPDATYVIGADVAEGLVQGDYSVAQVVDVSTGAQVAKLRGQWPIDHFARRLAELGRHYGEALLAPERNNHGHAVLNVLLNQENYPNLYRHEEYNARMGEVQKKWGWPTTTTSKPVMLAELDAGINDGTIVVRDIQTVTELKTMHWDGKGGVQAVSGCHDDDVMALGIANQIRKLPGRYQRAIDYFRPIVVKTEGETEAA